jgi:hypothetical protein
MTVFTIRVFLLLCIPAQVTSLTRRTSVSGGTQEKECAELKNHGSYFTVEIEASGQQLDVVVDTGSDELVVPSCQCNDGGACGGRCLREDIPSSVKKVSLSYGSGDLNAAVISGTVEVASLSVTMHESILLMYDNTLDLSGTFEGILALGPPHRESGNKRMVRLNGPQNSSDDATTEASEAHRDDRGNGVDSNGYFYTKSFLEEANIKSFSLCFVQDSHGIMRFDESPKSESLGSIGGVHWGLGLEGVSTGSDSKKMATCGSGTNRQGTKTTCGVIPDSGTTYIMAPQAQIDELYASLCDQWSHCDKVDEFESMVESCRNIDSLPPIHFHVTGTNSAKQLEVPPSTYVFRESSARCKLAFDVLDYHTVENGPIWILGMPIFFAYEVFYDVASSPPSMAFSPSDGCRSCSGSFLRSAGNMGAVTTPALTPAYDGSESLRWELSEPARTANIDVTQPL